MPAAPKKTDLTESVRIKLTKDEANFLHYLGQAAQTGHTKVARALFIKQLEQAFAFYTAEKARLEKEDAEAEAKAEVERIPESKL